MFRFSKNVKIKKLKNSLIYKHKLKNNNLYINKILEIPPEFCGIISINNKNIDEVSGEIKINSVNLPNIFKKISENNNNKKYFKCDLYLISKDKFEKEIETFKFIGLVGKKAKVKFNIMVKVTDYVKFFKFYKRYYFGNEAFNYILDLISEDLTYYLDKNNICLNDIINNEKNYEKIINKLIKLANKIMGIEVFIKYNSHLTKSTKQKRIKKENIFKINKDSTKVEKVTDNNQKNTNNIETINYFNNNVFDNNLVTSPFYKENLKDT